MLNGDHNKANKRRSHASILYFVWYLLLIKSRISLVLAVKETLEAIEYLLSDIPRGNLAVIVRQVKDYCGIYILTHQSVNWCLLLTRPKYLSLYRLL